MIFSFGHLMINYTITKSIKRIDKRGFLVEFLKGDEVAPSQKKLGQIYFVTFEKKGMVRGNHYHKKKDEWFVAVRGRLKVVLEDIKSKQRCEFMIDGDTEEYKRVFIGRNVAHSFQSLTQKAEMINYASKPYHKEDADINAYILI